MMPRSYRVTALCGFIASTLLVVANLKPQGSSQARPYQATGFKICEVDADSAIIWARLTRKPQRVGKERPQPIVQYKDPASGELVGRRGRQNMTPTVEFPDSSDIDSIEGAVAGSAGEVRVAHKEPGGDWKRTAWTQVDTEHDFTTQIHLSGLAANTAYEVTVESRRDGAQGETLAGRFKTAPAADATERVVFTVTTGTSYNDQDHARGGFKMYRHMLALNPSFFAHTGDIVYYDGLGKTLSLARWHWQRMYSLPTNIDFHRQVASYFIKDDHDTWMNDSWSTLETKFMGEFTWDQGIEVFREQVGMGEKTYRTVRWGKDLQIWMVEGRDYRSPNTDPDGPNKTIWGAEQKAWFKRTVEASDATFKVLISPTPIVGPDRGSKNDNHANEGFTHEGNEIRRFIGGQKNMYVVCGDRHWQYVSVDSESGVREYSAGPGSDEHAGGFREDLRTDEHQYLNIVGGFLAGTVDREGDEPVLTFRHYSVDGKVLHQDRLPAQ